MENVNQSTEPSVANLNLAEEVKEFYTGEFVTLLSTLFKNPLEGVYAIFRQPWNKALPYSMILYASVFVLFFIGGYLQAGESRQYMSFGYFLETALMPVLFMFLISVITFVIKSLSGKPDFKKELLTGALCGIPVAMLIPVMLIFKILGIDLNIFMGNLMNSGLVIGLVGLYLVTMNINIIQQSMRAAGTKDVLAWYLSTLTFVLALYVTIRIF